MVKWPKGYIGGDDGRFVTKSERGMYWCWHPGHDKPDIADKTEDGCVFAGGWVYLKCDNIPEKPEPIKVFDDGWYRVRLTWGQGSAFRERSSDGKSYDVGGTRRSLCFDAAYTEYERVIGFEKVIKAK